MGWPCGLIPLGSCAKITTAGLVWDMEDQAMGWGQLVSACNRVARDAIEVTTSDLVLWTLTRGEQASDHPD